MSLYGLEELLAPSAVAVVGASERQGSIGRALVENITKSGFKGSIYPVNPKSDEILGLKAYPSLEAIGGPVDLAVVATAIKTVPAIVAQCGKMDVKGAIIISAGGKETGDEGAAIEKEILAQAQKHKVRLIGPNCMGVVCSPIGLNASFMHVMPQPGSLAFISQSGAICSAVLDFSVTEKMGFSHFISIGSMIDVDFGDLIDYLGSDPSVSSILLYVETVANPRKFLSAARAVSRVKPIVVLKAGSSRAGAKAAQSHTGALAGEDAVYDAAFKRAGIVRVDTLEDLFGCAELMAKTPRPKGPNLAIVTNTGGPGVMSADFLAKYGLEPAALSEDTFAKIDALAPPIWSKSNPIDLTGAAAVEDLRLVTKICVEAEEIDGVMVMTTPQAMFSSTTQAEDIAQGVKDSRFPIFAVWMGGEAMQPGRQAFNQAGIPTYDSPEGAIRAFHYMYTYDRNLAMLQEIPTELSHPLRYDKDAAAEIIERALAVKHDLLTELEAKDILTAYGIPTNRTIFAATAEEAIHAARRLGYPVAAKLQSRQITHKSDAGGVKLDLRNADDVIDAFDEIVASARKYDPTADIQGVTVQSMIKEKGYEVILGSKTDPDFGPVLLFGMGGVMTEILKDRAIGLPPLNRLLARRMIEETKVYQLLKGYRNLPPANLALLEEILVRLSQLVIDHPEIIELDINPLVLSSDWAYAVDARMVIKAATKPSPQHVAICPYPTELEQEVVTASGKRLFIRPIRPEDAALLQGLYDASSETTRYNRLLKRVDVDKAQLARWTQIDYDRELALVALDQSGPEPIMVGLTRMIIQPNAREATWGVVVADPWQNQGTGLALLKAGRAAAEARGLDRLIGQVAIDNKIIQRLSEKIGARLEEMDSPEWLRSVLDL